MRVSGGICALSYQEIIGFDVAMDEIAAVQVLHARYHLLRDQTHCSQGEFPVAQIEQVLETWPEQVHDHHVSFRVAFRVYHLGDAGS